MYIYIHDPTLDIIGTSYSAARGHFFLYIQSTSTFRASQQEELGLLLGDTVGRMVLALVILHRNVESVWNVPAVTSQGVK